MSHERAFLRQKFVSVLSDFLDSGPHKVASFRHRWHLHSGQLLFIIDPILLYLLRLLSYLLNIFTVAPGIYFTDVHILKVVKHIIASAIIHNTDLGFAATLNARV